MPVRRFRPASSCNFNSAAAPIAHAVIEVSFRANQDADSAGGVRRLHAENPTPPLQHALGMVENRDDDILEVPIENAVQVVDACCFRNEW